MKSENILRAARNSLLCFSMALGAGFLVACGNTQDAPAAPSELNVSVSEVEQSESEILITWDAVPSATSYKLYRATVSGGEYAQIGDDLPALTLRYLDSGLDPNTEYFYQLEACNSGGCSGRSAEFSAATRVSPPVLTVVAQSDSEIEVTWDAVQDATVYNLYRSTVSGGEYAQIGEDLSTLTLYTDSGLSAYTEYFYQMEACNSGGCSRRLPEVSVTTRVSPPVLSVVAQSESEIEAAWIAVPGATVYNLYRSTVSGGEYAQIGEGLSTLTLYTDSELSPNTEYFYQLEACNSGGCSRRLPEVSATTWISPPVLTVVAQSDSEIEVTWITVQDATDYTLYRSTVSGGEYAQIGDDLSTLTLYTDSDLSAYTEYFYQMEACNSDGCSRRLPEVSAATHRLPEFAVYLSDAAAEGVEYSGPNGDEGLTWKGGVFSATKGVFEFSIADTTLGRVSLNIDWANAHVTPADFIGIDEQKVIDIARVMQGLDEDGLPRQNGISVSQRARTDVRGDLFDELTADRVTTEIDIFSAAYRFPSGIYTIPKERDAEDHFVATRKCLFTGVYDGNYRATSPDGRIDDGQIYYAVEPFARPGGKVTGVKFSNVNPSVGNNKGIATELSGPVDIGVIGSTITLSEGNELSFVTPRVVAGIWQEVTLEGGIDIAVSGTSALTLAEGNPGATRRIVGVDRGGNPPPSRILGLYVLDYFANDDDGDGDGSFSGRYYNIVDNVNFALSLTIVGDDSWSARTTDLILSGTSAADNGDITATAITVGSITRDGDIHDNDYGSFNATVGIGRTGSETGTILGTWCDISGATGVASPLPLPQSPKAPPRAVAVSSTRIDIAWDYPIEGARTYNLYRITAGEPPYSQVLVDGGIETRGYRDTGLAAGTKYLYQLEVCNPSGCSARSLEASATTLSPFSP